MCCIRLQQERNPPPCMCHYRSCIRRWDSIHPLQQGLRHLRESYKKVFHSPQAVNKVEQCIIITKIKAVLSNVVYIYIYMAICATFCRPHSLHSLLHSCTHVHSHWSSTSYQDHSQCLQHNPPHKSQTQLV